MVCWACRWNGGIEECIQNFGGILLGKLPLKVSEGLGKTTLRWILGR